MFGRIGGYEVLILMILGLLVFGRRLPEVGRSLGKGIVEFKKGLAGVEDQIDRAGIESQQEESKQISTDQHVPSNHA
jgi:sec-independent protein translocase protein TatA